MVELIAQLTSRPTRSAQISHGGNVLLGPRRSSSLPDESSGGSTRHGRPRESGTSRLSAVSRLLRRRAAIRVVVVSICSLRGLAYSRLATTELAGQRQRSPGGEDAGRDGFGRVGRSRSALDDA